ncbi:MAG: hypothetical protein ACFFCW_01915 [Candidatus Hodarchaeota archaeon]
METYELWHGIENHKSVTRAILKSEIENSEFGADDFFVPNVQQLQKVGEIGITGNTEQLDTYFDVNN